MNDNLFVRGFKIDWDNIPSESYLREIEAISNLNEFEFNKSITLFEGENGKGKSTLIEAIAISYGLNPEGGNRNFNFHTYDDFSDLYGAITLSRGYKRAKDSFFFRAESFYNIASAIDEYSMGEKSFYKQYGGKSLHCQSHGESFFAVITEKFRSNSFYILDEPEAALSPQCQLSVLAHIYKLAQEGSQFIIATHSPIFLGMPNSEIISFNNKLKKIDYKDTESYQVTSLFVNNREQMLNYLLN